MHIPKNDIKTGRSASRVSFIVTWNLNFKGNKKEISLLEFNIER